MARDAVVARACCWVGGGEERAALGEFQEQQCAATREQQILCQLCFSLSNCGQRRSRPAEEAAAVWCGTGEVAARASGGGGWPASSSGLKGVGTCRGRSWSVQALQRQGARGPCRRRRRILWLARRAAQGWPGVRHDPPRQGAAAGSTPMPRGVLW